MIEFRQRSCDSIHANQVLLLLLSKTQELVVVFTSLEILDTQVFDNYFQPGFAHLVLSNSFSKLCRPWPSWARED